MAVKNVVKHLVPVLLLALGGAGCRDRAEPSAARLVDPKAAAAPPGAAAEPKAAVVDSATPAAGARPEETDDIGVKEKEEDDPIAAAQNPDYVPAEHKSGASRWKDTVVYVDGQPRGVLTFGELPVPLEPAWVPEQKPAEIRPGSNDPGFTWTKKRRYRFTDYLKAIGVDVAKVQAIHIYGPKFTDSIVATGKQLRSKAGQELTFRFGADVGGKAIPSALEGFGNGRSPDKISSVMVYIKRKPPTLIPNDGFYLDGEKVVGVPYYGEPLRGGVRVYLDNALVAVIKRQELKPEMAEKLPDGTLRWKLHDFLKSVGVDDKGVTQAWVIRDERREEQLPAAEVAAATFEAASQAHGEILLGVEKYRAQAIALHRKPVTKADLPVILDDEL